MTQPNNTCPTCGGSGKDGTRLLLSNPPQLPKCPTCNGTGQQPETKGGIWRHVSYWTDSSVAQVNKSLERLEGVADLIILDQPSNQAEDTFCTVHGINCSLAHQDAPAANPAKLPYREELEIVVEQAARAGATSLATYMRKFFKDDVDQLESLITRAQADEVRLAQKCLTDKQVLSPQEWLATRLRELNQENNES